MDFEPIKPTQAQIENCEGMGWEYDGDLYFLREDQIGFFTVHGFYKETV